MNTDWRKDFNEKETGTATIITLMQYELESRAEVGRAKYGPDFKGDPLQQAYEEALDLAYYLRVQIARRETERAANKNVEEQRTEHGSSSRRPKSAGVRKKSG